MTAFDATTLPRAIRTLFELNHYTVSGPLQLHGAEIDLVAQALADPFARPIYIEATVEYVDNAKYGKDVGKLALVAAVEPDAQKLIVSAKGFSLPVVERARATRIITLTYDELFAKFERFEPYVSALTSEAEHGRRLAELDAVYEEPDFLDALGHAHATEYLTEWRDARGGRTGWLIVTGEYGTGKTALTRVLQYRWIRDYKLNPTLPLPFRIELRDFVRQFDANGLIHHFLDRNHLGHIPVAFVRTLIKEGRVVLLLDGYDEMAQYLHPRERRACLEALAELSHGGARGILTSRPNYFTEAEELQIFELLYRSLSSGSYRLTSDTSKLLEREKRIDELLGQFIERFERTLKDLTEPQTEALVARVLANDPTGREIVLGLLRRIFRAVSHGDAMSLSGKPVIVTYLLEVVEELKASQRGLATELLAPSSVPLNEWDIYKFIVDQLMLRDFERSPEIDPNDRRQFLRRLAILLSKKEHPVASEADVKDLIAKGFRRQLGRLQHDAKAAQIERYFADLRASATLTRASRDGRDGWCFSHNSLREYLVAEHFVGSLEAGDVVTDEVAISDAMRIFVASRPAPDRQKLLTDLARCWRLSEAARGKGRLLGLLWDGALQLFAENDDPVMAVLTNVTGKPIDLSGTALSRVNFAAGDTETRLYGASFANASLTDVNCSGADLTNADFTGAELEGVVLAGAQLSGARFSRALMVDVDLTGAALGGANFQGVAAGDISIVLAGDRKEGGRRTLVGAEALGFLQFSGADTEEVSIHMVVRHHARFSVVEKILGKLAEQSVHQRRGLVQRGAARMDVAFARRFVDFLEHAELISVPGNRRDMVHVSEVGRLAFGRFAKEREVPKAVIDFLRVPTADAGGEHGPSTEGHS